MVSLKSDHFSSRLYYTWQSATKVQQLLKICNNRKCGEPDEYE